MTEASPAARAIRRGSPLFLSVAVALALAGCHTDDDSVTGAISIDDYHNRHPIVLAEDPSTLDVFPAHNGALDESAKADIRAFVARYAQYGVGRMVILAPSIDGPGVRGGVGAIRRAAAAAGLHGSIGVGAYPVADPLEAKPIKLTFIGLKAEVPSQCGQWPSDLASGSSVVGWKNQTYWNYGCATQNMLAAQVADPRDFVRAGASGPGDIQMQLRAINDVRAGNDPGTSWKVQNSNIGQVGGGD
jgi:pilus assembly protein CpaD